MKRIPKIYDVFENRRKYPRLKIDFPVTIMRSDGVDIKGNFYDLSPDGAQLRYTGEEADRLFGGSMSMDDVKSSNYRLKTTLADGEFNREIEIGFSPVYQRHLDEKTYTMGIFFDGSDEKMMNAISQFLIYELQPAPDEVNEPAPGKDGQGAGREKVKKVVEEKFSADLQAGETRHAGDTDITGHKLDNIRQEILQITAGLKTLHEDLSEIKRRLDRIERK